MTKVDKIRLLLDATNSSERKNTFNEMTSVLNERIEIAKSISHDEKKVAFLTFIRDKFAKKYNEVREIQVRVYDKHLSEEAIDAALAYYTSENGATYISTMEKINTDVFKQTDLLSLELVQEIMGYLMSGKGGDISGMADIGGIMGNLGGSSAAGFKGEMMPDFGSFDELSLDPDSEDPLK